MERLPEDPASQTPFSDTQQTLERILEERLRFKPQAHLAAFAHNTGAAIIWGGPLTMSLIYGAPLLEAIGTYFTTPPEPASFEALIGFTRELSAQFGATHPDLITPPIPTPGPIDTIISNAQRSPAATAAALALTSFMGAGVYYGYKILRDFADFKRPGEQTRALRTWKRDELASTLEHLATNPNAPGIISVIEAQQGTLTNEALIEAIQTLATLDDENIAPLLPSLHRRSELNRTIPELQRTVRGNPNAHAIYSTLGAYIEGGIHEIHLPDLTQRLSESTDPRLTPAIHAIGTHIERYPYGIQAPELLSEYARVLKREDERGSDWTIKPSELFLTLHDGNLHPRMIRRTLETLEDVETNRDYFLERITRDDPEVISSAILFYGNQAVAHYLDDDQRFAISKRIIKNGNRTYAREFEDVLAYDHRIWTYLGTIDTIPGVGIEGLMDMIITVGSMRSTFSTFGLGHDESILRVLKPTKEDVAHDPASKQRIEAFLERYPSIDRDHTLNTFTEYSGLTGGSPFESSTLRKDERVAARGETLELRKAKKLVDEIEKRTARARYDAFRDAIKGIQHHQLEEIIEEPITYDVEFTPELTNVITAVKRHSSNSTITPTLKHVLRTRINEPENTATIIADLDTNRTLERRIGPSQVEPWRAGFVRAYDIEEDTPVRGARSLAIDAYGSLMSIARSEGIAKRMTPPRPDEIVAEAERIARAIAITGDENLVRTAQEHLETIRTTDLKGPVIIFYDSQDPIEAMQMGIVSGSCTSILGGERGFNASVTNAIDANKKVIYQTNEKGNRIGRTLAVLSDTGIITYEPYNTTSIDLSAAWVDYFSTYAMRVGTSLIVPVAFARDPPVREALKRSGAKLHEHVKATVHNTSRELWYDDLGRSVQNHSDLKYQSITAYVLKP